ncbi:three component ABC system middle component [Paenibacillus hunanensis]|uniref:IDEAL domain-containing protein n=1 Tax=Paenibacillus hunanensis TaxID=539262 RepID=A0ABU1IWA9_9BACL|nr:three component ABC system middle component [Paenibacillus hunanensis]MDR6242962.1 hypothetical protein [Paenibacillus hunanensis]GGJ13053.1 hypothetical protein GCM10008022_22680 [Paenibacillus hunanensis]
MINDFFYKYNEKKEIYNNEVFAALVIYNVIKKMNTIELTKALLIMPFISHKQTMKFLKNENTRINGIEEFIVKKPRFFLNFNDRYYSLLTVSLNSIMLLAELEVVSIENDWLLVNEMKPMDITLENCGERIFDVTKAIDKLSKLLNEKKENLYLQLRVEL